MLVSRSRLFALGGAVGSQAIAQLTNLVTGLFILQTLSVRDYAVYTIAGVLTGVGMVMANMSLYPATTYFLSRSQGDRTECNNIIVAANSIHVYILLLTSASLIVLGYTYAKQFSNYAEMIVIITLCIAQVIIAGRIDQAKSIAIGIDNIHITIQGDLIVSITRTVFIFLAVFFDFLSIEWILIVTIVANAFGLIFLSPLLVAQRQTADLHYRSRLLRYMYPLWPENIFYLVQGNVVLLILGWFGSHDVVAEVGALSRLVQIVTVLAVLNRVWAFPYVSRFRSASDLRKRGLIVIGMFVLAGLPFLLLAWLYPKPFLMLLGAQYEHLRPYVLPFMAVGIMNLVSITAYMICLATGRPGGLSLAIAPVLIVQISYILLIGVTSIATAIGLSAIVIFTELSFRLGLFIWLAGRSESIKKSVANFSQQR